MAESLHLTWRPFERADLAVTSQWDLDPETRRWMGSAWSRGLIVYVAEPGTPSGHTVVETTREWLIFDDRTPVALCEVECYADRSGVVRLVVAPDQRRRGVGRLVLEQLSEHCPGYELFGWVEPENVASVQMLESAGWRGVEADDGWIRYNSPEPRR